MQKKCLLAAITFSLCIAVACAFPNSRPSTIGDTRDPRKIYAKVRYCFYY